MSALIPTNKKDSTCTICLEQFGPTDPQLTHVGGENHDGFHPICLKKWLIFHSTCPHDRQVIDRSSLISRTELIRERFKTAMNNAILSACFGTVVAVVGIVATAGVNRVEASPLITQTPILTQIWVAVGGIAAGSVGLGTALGGAAIVRTFEGGTTLRAVASAVGAVALASAVATGTAEELAVGATLAAILGLMVTRLGAGFDAENVGYGIFAGGIASLTVSLFSSTRHALSLARTGLPLLAGTTAGLLSLIRG